MGVIRNSGIRSRMTLVAVAGSAVIMLTVVALMAFAMQSVMRTLIADDLSDHLDKAQAAVEQGDFARAVAFAGSDIMQVIGADGAVIASSPNARGLQAMVTDEDWDSFEVPDRVFEVYDDRLWDAAIGKIRDELDDGDGDSDDDDADDAADDDDDDSDTRAMPPLDDTHRLSPELAAEGPYVDAGSILGEKGPFLVMKRTVASPQGDVTLAAMTSLAPAVTSSQAAAQILFAIMALLLVLVGLLAWRFTGRTLSPVEDMRASVAAISANDLAARVPVPAGDRDLAPLAETFNDLLSRVQAAFDRQKRFVSDASHELKSPIAATGVMLEAMRAYPDSIDTQQAVEDLSSENHRMSRIVANMLVLARHDEKRTVIQKTPIDLFDVLHEEAHDLASRYDVEIDASGIAPIVCTADKDLLSMAVRNLLDNAARYAVSRVRLSCAQDGDTVTVTVSDDGPGIAAADRGRVFERFVRLEGAEPERSNDKGTGLGLSVVKSAVEQQGGTIAFVDGELGGATARITLPVE